MAHRLTAAYGYQGNNMDLPVKSVDEALPFYVEVLGFVLMSTDDGPPRSATLERDGISMRIAENGGDPEQDGCAFHVEGLDDLLQEFISYGLKKEVSDIKVEERNDKRFRVFYVVAPDGLCYWFGELQK
jgi:lactoylglutathione lyase